MSNRTYIRIAIISLGSFIIFQILWYIKSTFTESNLCESDVKFSDWVRYFEFLEAGAFIFISFLQLFKIYFTRGYYEYSRAVYAVSMLVNILAGSSAIMTTFWAWGGICVDNFGYNNFLLLF